MKGLAGPLHSGLKADCVNHITCKRMSRSWREIRRGKARWLKACRRLGHPGRIVLEKRRLREKYTPVLETNWKSTVHLMSPGGQTRESKLGLSQERLQSDRRRNLLTVRMWCGVTGQAWWARLRAVVLWLEGLGWPAVEAGLALLDLSFLICRMGITGVSAS